MFRQTLGFDVRLPHHAYVSALWTDDRRHTFLLNPGVAWPLSVDATVWPSLFRYDDLVPSKSLSRIQIEPVDIYQESLELWDSPSSMLRAVKESSGVLPSAVIPVAVEILSRRAFEEFEFWRAVLPDTLGPISDPWICLGYDVADASRLSGLTNCSYTSEARRRLEAEWGKTLNEFGLFSNPEAALDFARLTDHRVPEHSPFFAYGIYSNIPVSAAT